MTIESSQSVLSIVYSTRTILITITNMEYKAPFGIIVLEQKKNNPLWIGQK